MRDHLIFDILLRAFVLVGVATAFVPELTRSRMSLSATWFAALALVLYWG